MNSNACKTNYIYYSTEHTDCKKADFELFNEAEFDAFLCNTKSSQNCRLESFVLL